MKLWLQPQPSRWSHRRFDATDARWIRNSSARFWPHSGALLLWSGSSVVNKQTNKQTDKHLLTQRLRPPSTLMAIKLNTWTDVCSFRIDNRWLSDTIDMKDGLKQPPLKFQSMLQKMSIDCLFKTDLKFDISWFRSIWSAFYWILWEILEWGLLHFFSLSLFFIIDFCCIQFRPIWWNISEEEGQGRGEGGRGRKRQLVETVTKKPKKKKKRQLLQKRRRIKRRGERGGGGRRRGGGGGIGDDSSCVSETRNKRKTTRVTVALLSRHSSARFQHFQRWAQLESSPTLVIGHRQQLLRLGKRWNPLVDGIIQIISGPNERNINGNFSAAETEEFQTIWQRRS